MSKATAVAAKITSVPAGEKIFKNSTGRYFKDTNGDKFYISESGKLLKGQEQPVMVAPKAAKAKPAAAAPAPTPKAAKPAKPAPKAAPAAKPAKAAKAEPEAAAVFAKLNKKGDDVQFSGTKAVVLTELANGSVSFTSKASKAELVVSLCFRGNKMQVFITHFDITKNKFSVALDQLTTLPKAAALIQAQVEAL